MKNVFCTYLQLRKSMVPQLIWTDKPEKQTYLGSVWAPFFEKNEFNRGDFLWKCVVKKYWKDLGLCAKFFIGRMCG